MELTPRMQDILAIIGKRNNDGSYVDLDQILDTLKTCDQKVSKAAIQFTLRSMRKKQVIDKAGCETRRKRTRVLYKLTKLGVHSFQALYIPEQEDLEEQD